MTGKDRMASYIFIYKKKKRINVYFLYKEWKIFRFVLLWTAGSWHVEIFFKILKKKKKRYYISAPPHITHHIRRWSPQYFSAVYPFKHPHIRSSAHPHFTGGPKKWAPLLTLSDIPSILKLSSPYTFGVVFPDFSLYFPGTKMLGNEKSVIRSQSILAAPTDVNI